jgi:hypothetical protein
MISLSFIIQKSLQIITALWQWRQCEPDYRAMPAIVSQEFF